MDNIRRAYYLNNWRYNQKGGDSSLKKNQVDNID